MNKLKVGGFLDNSLVNGIGLRSVIFVSGCTHECQGCHNQELQCFSYGEEVTIEEIMDRIKKNLGIIRGVTLSGGDPMEQPQNLMQLSKEIKKLNLNIWCYTGYTYEEILNDQDKSELLKEIDVLVDGPFILKLKDEGLKYKGSSNQRIIDVKKSIEQDKVVLLDI
ncbi:anaerobic ribonucleoside-triphosphate reductase activating protein [Clostridium cellulovorans]|uniref:Anaerobic ribonucleoside-triphosphate reductase-activating protein n=1 Tax=Clostridium cellulovorans (strain ATCC 35296 / DSM 3052 / OCM 3 / 743B) TaxID=573061 RepID=D9SQ57_CLOC7|nr:anaerobic ribonucleoside-triphosphate reductase activating protein [Clostridium cellulovorans]ADL50124.1 anaerobic ribonucleoside-triphosphate reductase activating protein [Clostridium cellulovorans 743B]